jgi:hypothetical protein
MSSLLERDGLSTRIEVLKAMTLGADLEGMFTKIEELDKRAEEAEIAASRLHTQYESIAESGSESLRKAGG